MLVASTAVLVAGLLLFFGFQQDTSAQQFRPNIIFVLTDDQDTSSLNIMPNVKKRLVQGGKTFRRATFAYPLCCPSRATILRGQYPHNTSILDNEPPFGGHETFRSMGRAQSTYATWLKASGYNTGYFGKYMNGYDNETYIPPGWNRWVAADHAPATMRVSDNGRLVDLKGTYETFDLAMKNYSIKFLQNNLKSPRPLFMTVSFSAPHTEFGIPKYERRYATRFSTSKLPKSPNFNEQDRSDKPEWVRRLPAVTPEMENKMTVQYRARLRSLLTIDNTVEEYIRVLWRNGELNNTYIFYFTDNGYHMGSHAIPDVNRGIGGKSAPYTEDVEFPLIVRGPGIAPNTTDGNLVSNTDLAPTFADIASANPTYTPDGRSLLPLLHGENAPWRDALLVEGKHDKPYPEYPEGWLSTYKVVRTIKYAYHYYPDTAEEELYDLEADPYQLQSLHDDPAHADVKATLRSKLEALKDCAGDTCRAAEGG